MDRLPFTNYQLFFVLAAGFGQFFDFYDLTCMSFAIPSIVNLYGLNSVATTFLIASVFIGMFFGSLISGYLSDKLGRKKLFIYTLVIMAVGGFLTGISQNYTQLFVTRLLTGFGIGGDLPVIWSYYSEFIAPQLRSKWQGIQIMIASSSFLVAAFFGSFVVGLDAAVGWRYIFLLGAIIALVILPIRSLAPESPRYLLGRSKPAEALAALEKIEAGVKKRLGRPLPPPVPVKLEAVAGKATFREILGAKYISRTVQGCLLMIFQGIGFQAFTSFLPLIIVSKGYTIVRSLQFTAVADIGAILGALSIFFIGQRVQGKYIMLYSGAMTGLSMIVMAYSFNPIMVMLFGFTAYFFSQSQVTSLYLYLAELFPTRARSTGAGVANGVGRGMNLVGLFVVGVALAGNEPLQLGFIGLMWFLYAITIAVVGIKTKDVSLEKIAQ
jgi:putative MFS transporter